MEENQDLKVGQDMYIFPLWKELWEYHGAALGKFWEGKVMQCQGASWILPGLGLSLKERGTSKQSHNGGTFLILMLYSSFLYYFGGTFL